MMIREDMMRSVRCGRLGADPALAKQFRPRGPELARGLAEGVAAGALPADKAAEIYRKMAVSPGLSSSDPARELDRDSKFLATVGALFPVADERETAPRPKRMLARGGDFYAPRGAWMVKGELKLARFHGVRPDTLLSHPARDVFAQLDALVCGLKAGDSVDVLHVWTGRAGPDAYASAWSRAWHHSETGEVSDVAVKTRNWEKKESGDLAIGQLRPLLMRYTEWSAVIVREDAWGFFERALANVEPRPTACTMPSLCPLLDACWGEHGDS